VRRLAEKRYPSDWGDQRLYHTSSNDSPTRDENPMKRRLHLKRLDLGSRLNHDVQRLIEAPLDWQWRVLVVGVDTSNTPLCRAG